MESRPKRTKVKSGCRTCKIRKVKCDEARPVCFRCLSTGRVCEGYGIWGGGGNHYGHRHVGSNTGRTLTGPYTLLVGTADKEESRHLEWFTRRTVPKLPGAFRSYFWDSLVFQAASDELAVLHAVLALSSAHRREGLCVDASAPNDIPDEQEQFTLQHYSRAITNLQPHFSDRTNSSRRVALITCLLFVVMEYLQGRCKTGHTHLQNGLKLIKEFQACSGVADNYSISRNPCCDSADASIIQAFIRLDIQAKFLGQGSVYLNFAREGHSSDPPASALVFQSFNQARQHLDRLFSQIFFLSHQCRRQAQSSNEKDQSSLVTRQRRLKEEVDLWYRAFKTLGTTLLTSRVTFNSIAHALLRLYYLVAEIMCDTCLFPADELRYDLHTRAFESIIHQLNSLRSLSFSPDLIGVIHFSDMSSSTIDLGAIPALYYVAVKCRIHRIRNKAVEYLHTLHHKEGIWCSPLVARIVEEVVKVEEGDFYEGLDITSSNDSETGDARQPILPASYRLHDVEIELPDGYAEAAVLKYRRRFDDYNWEMVTREFVYDKRTQSWIAKA